ncbi:MAG: hypothetical protein JWO15_453 [Sphingomonadales bacterium]|nr:hypothetical protein [Sphingomonadales bacterium]
MNSRDLPQLWLRAETCLLRAEQTFGKPTPTDGPLARLKLRVRSGDFGDEQQIPTNIFDSRKLRNIYSETFRTGQMTDKGQIGDRELIVIATNTIRDHLRFVCSHPFVEPVGRPCTMCISIGTELFCQSGTYTRDNQGVGVGCS